MADTLVEIIKSGNIVHVEQALQRYSKDIDKWVLASRYHSGICVFCDSS